MIALWKVSEDIDFLALMTARAQKI